MIDENLFLIQEMLNQKLLNKNIKPDVNSYNILINTILDSIKSAFCDTSNLSIENFILKINSGCITIQINKLYDFFNGYLLIYLQITNATIMKIEPIIISNILNIKNKEVTNWQK